VCGVHLTLFPSENFVEIQLGLSTLGLGRVAPLPPQRHSSSAPVLSKSLERHLWELPTSHVILAGLGGFRAHGVFSQVDLCVVTCMTVWAHECGGQLAEAGRQGGQKAVSGVSLKNRGAAPCLPERSQCSGQIPGIVTKARCVSESS
jgi:hypothetical protein